MDASLRQVSDDPASMWPGELRSRGTDDGDCDSEDSDLELHDIDIVEAFDLSGKYSVSRHVRNDKTTMLVLICMHCLFSLSFCSHAAYLRIYSYSAGMRIEVWENISAAALYFSAGVLFVRFEWGVENHGSMIRIVSVAQGVKRGRFRSKTKEYLKTSKYLWPILLVLGIWGPVLVWIPEVYPDRPDDSIIGKKYIGILVLTSLIAWASTTLVFGPAKLDSVGFAAAECVVDGVVDRVERITANCMNGADSEDEWRSVLKQVRSVDYLLSDIFSLDSIGGLMLLRMMFSFVMALILCGVGTVHRVVSMRIACMVAGVLSASGGTYLLFGLCTLTDKCCGNEPGQQSITAAVSRRVIGARLCGVLITKELVLSVGLRTCVYLPTAATFLGMRMSDADRASAA